MPFLIVQRYNGSLSALTRSSPADGEKNLHRRIFLFQGGIAIFYIRAVVFISPNLAGLGCRREYRHDKNTAYSGSLDARRNNQQQIGLMMIRTTCCLYNLLSWLSVVKTIYRQNNLAIKLSINKTIYRHFDISICRTIELSIKQQNNKRNEPAPHLITVITQTDFLCFSIAFSLFPCLSSFLAVVLPRGYFCTREVRQWTA